MDTALHVKRFSELSTDELYRIYQLRVSVFVVEQHCPYQEVDELDTCAYHVWLETDGKIVAYARVLPQNTAFESVGIGRVIAAKRRCGLGTRIVAAAVDVAKKRHGAGKITLEAQVYARSLYEKAGFRAVSDEFLEDGIPHVRMEANV